MASTKNPGKWKPGGRGRPPKNAAEIVAAQRREEPVAPPRDPPPPLDDDDTDDETGGAAPAPIDGAPPAGQMENPLLEPLPPDADNVIQLPGTGGGPPLPVHPWEDPKKYAPLIVPATMAWSFGLDWACARYGRQPVKQEKFHKSGLAKLSAQTLVAFYPELGDIDPRYALLGTLASTAFALVMSQPAIAPPHAAEQPAAPAAPTTAPRSDDNVRPIRPNIDATEVASPPSGPNPDEAS